MLPQEVEIEAGLSDAEIANLDLGQEIRKTRIDDLQLAVRGIGAQTQQRSQNQ